MKHSARKAGHMRTRRACNLGISSDPKRTHIARSVPWDNDGIGLLHGAHAHGSSDPAKMTLEERRMLRAWDNTGGTGYTVEWLNGYTRKRRMPAKESSKKWDGDCTSIGPIEPAAVETERKRISYTDAVQHGIVVEEN